MTDETSRDVVRFVIRTGKVSAKALWKGLCAVVRAYKHHKQTGKQSVKTLIRQGQGATSMEVSGESLRTFKRIANKYGVDFAIVKEKTSDPVRYNCFFKAKDMDAITAVVKEYSDKVVKREQRKEKPSLINQIRKLKEEIAKHPRKEKVKNKEIVR